MLLFRPTLSKYCTSRDTIISDPLITLNDSLPERVALQCSIICVKVAQEVIELVYHNIPTEGSSDFLPAWWYNILCEYSLTPRFILLSTNQHRCLYGRHCIDRRPSSPYHSGRSHAGSDYTVLELCPGDTTQIPKL